MFIAHNHNSYWRFIRLILAIFDATLLLSSILLLLLIDKLLIEMRRFWHIATVWQCVLLTEQLLGLFGGQLGGNPGLAEDKVFLFLWLRGGNGVSVITFLELRFELSLHVLVAKRGLVCDFWRLLATLAD